MNKKEKREVLGIGFYFAGLVIAIGNLWAILVTNQPIPFPPISSIFGVCGLILTFWGNE